MKMNSPISVGESNLDLCKTIIYEFYYNYVIPKWSKH